MKLELRQLHKRLAKKWILQGVELSCGAGEVAVILGDNGSGKSTLLRLVSGILEPDHGHVFLNGAEVSRSVQARHNLGYVPDSAEPLPELTIAELLSLACALKRVPPPSPELTRRLGLDSFLQQRMGTLSFGQRKRTCLMMALLGDPWLLVLDEPTSGLDPEGMKLILDLITDHRHRGGATLLSTHDQPFADALLGSNYRLNSGLLSTGNTTSCAATPAQK